MNRRRSVLPVAWGAWSLATLLLATACQRPVTAPQPSTPVPRLIPAPTSLTSSDATPFTITRETTIAVEGGADAARIGEMLAALLRPSTGYPLLVSSAPNAPATHAIRLVLATNPPSRNAESYDLTVSSDSVRVVAGTAAGLFYGIQTLRQLLPFEAESHLTVSRRVWTIPAVTVADEPRFAWRGAMLDVARHFFTVREVKQFIDLLALYKMNVLHLHLADDQGWRIAIDSRPKLTEIGSVSQVGGGPGGFFTKQDYTDIVRYAQERYITVVPEIDMPGHTNAALSGYPELGCSSRPSGTYTGTEVGWSTLCVDKEETYAFVDDVVREISALTPGAYFHIGGDEVMTLTHDQYVRFVERVQDIVVRNGKQMIGWEEITKARLRPTTIAQQWKSDSVRAALQYGAKILLSPASKTYLDMKYTPATELGLHWAGYIEVRDAYDWDPATYLAGVPESQLVGVEAPIWSETLRNITAVEYLAVPRLPALAEVGWSRQGARDWEGFRVRLAAHAPRWRLLGVNYYPSPQVPW
jgi:hexosaminidase